MRPLSTKTKRKTITGHRATRRIKWFNPTGFGDHQGKKTVNVFVILQLQDNNLKALKVSSQLGIDRRGNMVLPDNWIAPDHPNLPIKMSLVVYSVGAIIGQLDKAALDLENALNRALEQQDMWIPPSSTDSFQFRSDTQFRPSLRINV